MSATAEFHVRPASASDVPALAELRLASHWDGGADGERMARYLAGDHHPRHALAPRVLLVAVGGGQPIGFIAGHRTTRFGCDGELQWLLVAPAARGRGVSDRLVAALGDWFATQKIRRVCVNVEPDNSAARRCYARLGARPLSDHWMEWPDLPAACRRPPH